MTASGTFTAGEFMARLRPTDRDELTARSRARRWPAGASLFLEGEQSSTVVVVATGRVKVFQLTESGEEIVLAVRGPGALLGELSAIDGLPRSASVAALEPVVAHVMHVEAFRDFLDSHAPVAVALLHLVVERLRDADRKRVEFAAYDTSARVAQRIVELAERFGEPDAQGTRITVALSQDELAGWVGASREAVAKALRTLREQRPARHRPPHDDRARPRRAAPPRGTVVNAPTTITASATAAVRRRQPGPPRHLGVPPGAAAGRACGCCSPCRPPTSCGSTTRATSGWCSWRRRSPRGSRWPSTAPPATTATRGCCSSGSASSPPRCSSGCTRSPPRACCSTTPTAGSPSPHPPGSRCRRCSGRRPRWTWTAPSAGGPCERARTCATGSSASPRVWGVVSLTGLPPLADPGVGERGSVAVVVLVVLAVPLYLAAALRCFLLYRRRRSVVLLSS